jgi:MAE_28990/MAE_18760-like HEPN
MIRVQQDFQDRVTEIEAYFDFIRRVESGAISLTQTGASTPAYGATEKADLLRTFRASAFLLLYNLMESTVTNAIEAIFDELEVQGVSFDDCSVKVRSIVLRNLKAMGTEASLPVLNRIATDVISKTFDKDKIVSGNVDAELIRGLADKYGFEHPKVPQVWQRASIRGFSDSSGVLPSGERLAGNGSKLLEVKNRRNKLAHGNTSFADVGRDFSCDDIMRIKCEVIAYLDAVLQTIADYIVTQSYLR